MRILKNIAYQIIFRTQLELNLVRTLFSSAQHHYGMLQYLVIILTKTEPLEIF